jgi:hypothetical protein
LLSFYLPLLLSSLSSNPLPPFHHFLATAPSQVLNISLF